MGDLRKVRAHLTDLTKAVMAALDQLDAAMKEPESRGRGEKVAAIANALEMANDRARYFGLGIDYRSDKKRKRL